jgi:DNA-binding SARP family transcriptional activator
VGALAAAARLDPARRRGLIREARILAGALGIPPAILDGWLGDLSEPRPGVVVRARPAPISVWCFGGFRMAIGEDLLDLSPVRPRARTALHLLALRAGQPVHRDALIEALWADLPPEAATRNMHVAVSSLRGYLEPGRERGKSQLVVRAGEAYSLALPAGAYADTAAFQDAMDRWRQARIAQDDGEAVLALRAALAAYGGELLPEDGPAEWLLHDREVFRRQAANASCALATAELAAGSPDEAASVAEQCVAIDPYHDAGWQVLLQAYVRSGERAAAEQTRRRYAAVLASLGISGEVPDTPAALTPARKVPALPRQPAGPPTHRRPTVG